VYVRRVDGEDTTFGVSGRLWRDALVLYDRKTTSFWTQIDGRALTGEAVGQRLEEIPSIVSSWGAWKDMYPDTLVLRPSALSREGSHYEEYLGSADLGIFGTPNPDDRLDGKSAVLGILVPGNSSAVPLGYLQEHSPLNEQLGPEPVLIVSVGGGRDGAAYRRTIGGRILDFDAQDAATLKDRQTATVWDARTGRAIEGPLEGDTLDRLETRRGFWFIWAAFYPDTGLLGRETWVE
jgi:hypothetical protein